MKKLHTVGNFISNLKFALPFPENKNLKCKLCLEDKKLVKSHIIPRSFFKVDDPKEGYFAITSNPEEFKRRIPTGYYDEDILCLDCEKKFGPWDTYGNEFLNRKELPTKTLIEGNKKENYIEPDFDYTKLKMFFLSVLWRGHHSKQDFFTKIRLHLHEKRIREMIITNDPKGPDDYSVILSKFDEDRASLSPQFDKCDQVNCYRLYLSGFIAVIKVDKRPMKGIPRELILSPGKKGIILLMNSRGSNELNAIKKIFGNYNKAHPKP